MPKTTRIAKTAPDGLKILWEEGYFRAWRDQGAIVGHLAKRGNNFSGPELGMALKRATHLTRKGRRGSYQYIQKYPFVQEDQKSAKKKKAKP